MITEDEIERAVSWLRDNAVPAAQARAERLYLAEWIKTVRAEQQVAFQRDGTSAAAAEALALASEAYKQALQAFKEAVEADERYRFLVSAAEARIEAWRSMEASRRAEGKAY